MNIFLRQEIEMRTKVKDVIVKAINAKFTLLKEQLEKRQRQLIEQANKSFIAEVDRANLFVESLS